MVSVDSLCDEYWLDDHDSDARIGQLANPDKNIVIYLLFITQMNERVFSHTLVRSLDGHNVVSNVFSLLLLHTCIPYWCFVVVCLFCMQLDNSQV